MLKFQSVSGHHFYDKLLEASSIVIDLGAGKGEFAEGLDSMLSCEYYEVEANPQLCSQIRDAGHIRKFNYAVSDSSGEVKFYISNIPNSSSLYPQISAKHGINKTIVVPSITLEDFLNANNIRSIDLLKIDIEGSELDFFNSAKDGIISNIKQISVEFHDFIEGVRFGGNVEKIIKRLKKLGFFCLRFGTVLNADVLFINKNVFRFTDLKYLYLWVQDTLSLKYMFIARMFLFRAVSKLRR